MREPTVYSAKCTCCGNVILSMRPIQQSTKKGVVRTLGGFRHVEACSNGASRVWSESPYAPVRLMGLSEAEMWLIQGEECLDV